MAYELFVEVTRNNTVESRHFGAAVVCDVKGEVLHRWGDIEGLVFPRSGLFFAPGRAHSPGPGGVMAGTTGLKRTTPGLWARAARTYRERTTPAGPGSIWLSHSS